MRSARSSPQRPSATTRSGGEGPGRRAHAKHGHWVYDLADWRRCTRRGGSRSGSRGGGGSGSLDVAGARGAAGGGAHPHGEDVEVRFLLPVVPEDVEQRCGGGDEQYCERGDEGAAGRDGEAESDGGALWCGGGGGGVRGGERWKRWEREGDKPGGVWGQRVIVGASLGQVHAHEHGPSGEHLPEEVHEDDDALR